MPSTASAARFESALSAVVRIIGSRVIQGRIAACADTDLTPVAIDMLEYLAASGPLRVSDVAVCNGVDISTATVRIQRLQRDGLVARSSDPEDRRASVITISEQGRAAVERLRAARHRLLGDVLQDVPSADLARTAELLNRIEAHLLTSPPALSERR